MNSFLKINQFYIALIFILILLASLVTISLRGIFDAMSTAGQVDEELLSSTLPRVNIQKIDEALKLVNDKEFTPLDF